MESSSSSSSTNFIATQVLQKLQGRWNNLPAGTAADNDNDDDDWDGNSDAFDTADADITLPASATNRYARIIEICTSLKTGISKRRNLSCHAHYTSCSTELTVAMSFS